MLFTKSLAALGALTGIVASPIAADLEDRALRFTQTSTVAASMQGHGYGIQTSMGGQLLTTGLHFLDGTLLVAYKPQLSFTYQQGPTTPTGNASNAQDTFGIFLTLYKWFHMDFLSVETDNQFFPVWHGKPLVPATLGFGFNNDRVEDGLSYGPSWWQQASGSWPEPTIGLYLNPVYHALNVTHLDQLPKQDQWLSAGSIKWGGIDSYYSKGNVNYVNVMGPVIGTEQNWLFAGDGIKVNGASMDLGGVALTFTPFLAPWIQLPRSVADKLHEGVAGAVAVDVTSDQGDMRQYSVPCGATEVITLTLGGVDYPIPPILWVKRNNDGTCASAFQTIPSAFGDGPYFMQLGTTFLSTVYTVLKFNAANDSPAQLGFSSVPCGRAAIDARTGSTKYTPCGSGGGLLSGLLNLFH